MQNRMVAIFTKIGPVLCSLAIYIAGLSKLCCRGHWYQPKEPEGLENFVKKHKKR